MGGFSPFVVGNMFGFTALGTTRFGTFGGLSVRGTGGYAVC